MTYQNLITFGHKESPDCHVVTDDSPHHFGNDRYSLLFEGEIYNNKALYDQLQQKEQNLETAQIHDVIASLFIAEGVEAFAMLSGKFAILIWDHDEAKMYGARDRFGIQSLYYLHNDQEITFTTSKKKIPISFCKKHLNTAGLQHYLTYQYVPEPMTFTKKIMQIKPGHYFIKEQNEPMVIKQYFHARFDPVEQTEDQLTKRIRNTICDSIEAHMQGDLSIGTLLSGGIDSTIIAAVAKEINPSMKTFSAGFARDGYSEIHLAKKTADELGLENISRLITPEEYVEKLPEIMWHMDDPLGDPSCIPLYFVNKEASKHVQAVLSGEGADELFGGYNIYREFLSLKVFEKMPHPLLAALNKVSAIFPEGMAGKSFIERGTTPLRDRYIGNAKIFPEEAKKKILMQYKEHMPYQTITAPLYDQVEGKHPVTQMQYIDIHTWLPGDILLKGEKMSFANSLEIRAPFLDKEVFNVAKSISVDHKISHGTTKHILRQAFKGIIPDHVLYQKKLGFPVPIRHWLKDELYEWAEQLIYTSETEHLIDKKAIISLLHAHVQNKHDYSREIWTVLMFMVWYQVFIEQIYSFEQAQLLHK